MRTVSLPIEILRSRPGLVFWLAALAQAILWTFATTLFYASPPGDVPFVLAAGHALRMGTESGPPLAYWLADFAFSAAGNRAAGLYALSQICVVATYWAVFRLGRATLGPRHA